MLDFVEVFHVGIVWEIREGKSWRSVSVDEYESFPGRKRTRAKGIPAGFQEVNNILLAYAGGRL